jgi:MFS family permease
MLIVFRAFQGLAVAAFGVSSTAMVADVFPPDQRGRAMGLAILPTLVGPMIGPLIGGGLSQAFGWRRCGGACSGGLRGRLGGWLLRAYVAFVYISSNRGFSHRELHSTFVAMAVLGVVVLAAVFIFMEVGSSQGRVGCS